MKRFFSPCFLTVYLFLPFYMNAQKPVFNHLALYVTDLQKSTVFYRDVIGLDTIPEPFHDGKHTWFAVGPTGHLHVIAGAASPTPHAKDNHLCFSVPSVDAFVKRLNKANIPYEDWPGKPQSITTRVDGVKQIYFKDPDGYWIEINDAVQ
ncbi:VOC family protein [Flavisolibacter ginsenosidimutans]|nr:VOC family protein [Flavisolibacter ginsenosidimutans]